VNWTFDAFGRRIRQRTSVWTNNTWAVVEDLKLISDPMLFGRHIVELNATNNTPVRGYVWGLDLSGTMDGAGGVGGLLWLTLYTASGAAPGTHFAAYDGNGNVVALVSATSGTETARYEYGPFAEPIRITGPAANLNPFRFSTKRTDPTTDLVLYEYRAYSPCLGRWMSRDPIAEIGGVNLLVLTMNSAVGKVDVLGLISPRDPRDPGQREEYNPPQRPNPCCCAKPPCTPKVSASDAGSRPGVFKMKINGSLEGCCHDIQIRWTTCYRQRGQFGNLPHCNDKWECDFLWDANATEGAWAIGIFIWYQTCESGHWQKKVVRLGLYCHIDPVFLEPLPWPIKYKWICEP